MISIEKSWSIGPALRALRPQAIHWLELANANAWSTVDPVLLELVRLRIAAFLGNDAALARRASIARARGLTEEKIGQLDVYYKSPDFSAVEKECLGFVELFVMDVSSITEVDVEKLAKFFSSTQLHAFVVALYVTECTQRLEMMEDILFSGARDQIVPVPAAQACGGTAPVGVDLALERYQEAVVLGTALDPIVTEMVRLRCARTHNCRICKTVRLVGAREAGVDDAMTGKIDFYETSDLDERIKTALRIADAFITRPGTLTAATVQAARASFTLESLAELCLDITKWSTQKIHVALGTDGADTLPKNDQGVSFFTFDGDGRVAGFTAAP